MNKKMLYTMLMVVLGMLACVSSSTPAATEAPADAPVLVTVTLNPTSVPASSTPEIQHVDVPGELPVLQSALAGDQDSSVTAEEMRAPGGDRFTFGRYERPFNADVMDVYFPEIDILKYRIFRDNTWVYIEMELKEGDEAGKLSGKYGVELDLDLDGRGDWLVLAHRPSSTDWSTDEVEVWFDTNNDVGGLVSIAADEQSDGNGFETLLFDGGKGDDPDLAWVRVSPGQPNTIHIAFKSALLEDSNVFMAGVWAGTDDLDPSMFDLNDHFTHDQAGSSLVEFEFYYPIKAISEIDNACRVAVGFQPTGGEPGICPVVPKEDEDGGCPPEYTYCIPFGQQIVCYCLQP